jgi:cobalamin biosynthesis Co2+ chelatase CbiK
MIDIIFSAILMIFGYLYTQLMYDIKSNRERINELQINLPTKYVSKDDLTAHLNRIEVMLDKIFDRLDQKVDKS